MKDLQQVVTRDPAFTELLAKVALHLMATGQLPTAHHASDAATAPQPADTTKGRNLTVGADQVKVVGAGRRPASLTGRQVTVTLVATVVAEHENGALSVTVDEADRWGRRPRAKRAAKASRRATSKGRGRSTRKHPTRRAAAKQAKEGTA